MYISGIIVNVVSLIFPATVMVVYSKLFLSIFCFKTLRRVPEQSLFYFRFGLDTIYNFSIFLNLFLILLSLTKYEEDLASNGRVVFFIIWSVYVIGMIRDLLALVIAVDRTFATYLPVTFYKYRKVIPTFAIITLVLSNFFPDIYVLYIYCENGIDLPPGCVTMLCAPSVCYISYWLNYESANRLVLIDAFILILFNLTPTIILSLFRDSAEYLGPLNAFFKTFGFVVESHLVSINLGGKAKVMRVTSSVLI
ncbi:hypothetical protein CRE_08774 [Caenorhabditis remanei]|uniref:G-protein coupled receptors family 1 profile domain-containing protein n=1 Tax=Caenorhabditis remanei TaxID=31234 RepID=E3LHG4_CAERE|nr:hypothetical protein CRE_08774 [Caenorhabditis remanei]